MIAVNLTAFTNPLSTEIGVFRHTGVFAPGVSIAEVKRAFGYELPLVMVNGQMVEDSVQMHEDFSLVLATEAHGGAFKQILVAAAIGAITGGIGYAFGFSNYASLGEALIGGAITGGISAGVGIVVSKLIGSPGSTQQVSRDDIPAYGLSGVSNSARGLGPVNWSFGRTLVAPPLDARQWTHAVDDGVNVVTETYYEYTEEFACSVVSGVIDECPAWSVYDGSAQWVQLGATTIYRSQKDVITAATASGQDVSSYSPKAMLYDSATDSYQLENVSGWETDINLVLPKVNYVAQKTRQGYLNTEELTASFNFGLGDLVLDDERFNHSPISDFHGIVRSKSVAFSDRSKLGQDNIHPNLPNAILSAWPDDCLSLAGGELRQNSGVAGTAQEWVVREFYGNCDVIGVDLSGNLYSQDNSGNLVNLTAVFEIQWSINNSAWQPAGVGASGVVSITNNSTFPVRESYDWLTNSTAEHFRVRVRRVSADSTKPTEQSQINFTKARFMAKTATTKASPLDLGVAQTRTAFAVKATGQLSGNIQDYSAVVSAKAWVWKGGSVWDGSYPGGANWSWEVTSNPAWCYAYALQGIHICTTSSNGWCVGPESATGQRIAGAGVEASLIDWQALVEWAAFCDSEGFEFNYTFQTGTTTLGALQTIARCGRASPVYAWGRWSIVVERSDAVASSFYGPHNIIADSLTMTYEHPTVDEIVVKYIDSETEDWRQDEVVVLVPGASIPNERLETEITGCTNKAQAEKEARLIAARQHWQVRSITFDCLNDGLLRGDIINVFDSVLGAGYTSRVRAQSGNVITVAHYVEETSMDIVIRSPDGTSQTFTGTRTGDNEITLSGTPSLNPDGFEGVIEDYVVHMSPLGLKGYKRFRVVSVRPQQGFKLITVEATEEPLSMWDYVNGGTNTDTEIIDRTVARCENPMIVKDPCGEYYLHWTNNGCVWVNVTVKGSTALVNGERMLISGVAPGDTVGVVLTPNIEVQTAYKIETLTTTVTV